MKGRGKHPEKALTAVQLRQLIQPGRYADGNGLYLVVDPSGAKRWLLRLVVQGRRRDIGLGGAGLVTLAEARERAVAYRKTTRDPGGGVPHRSGFLRVPRSDGNCSYVDCARSATRPLRDGPCACTAKGCRSGRSRARSARPATPCAAGRRPVGSSPTAGLRVRAASTAISSSSRRVGKRASANATVLYRELREHRFTGGYDIVRRWAVRQREGAPVRPPSALSPRRGASRGGSPAIRPCYRRRITPSPRRSTASRHGPSGGWRRSEYSPHSRSRKYAGGSLSSTSPKLRSTAPPGLGAASAPWIGAACGIFAGLSSRKESGG